MPASEILQGYSATPCVSERWGAMRCLAVFVLLGTRLVAARTSAFPEEACLADVDADDPKAVRGVAAQGVSSQLPQRSLLQQRVGAAKRPLFEEDRQSGAHHEQARKRIGLQHAAPAQLSDWEENIPNKSDVVVASVAKPLHGNDVAGRQGPVVKPVVPAAVLAAVSAEVAAAVPPTAAASEEYLTASQAKIVGGPADAPNSLVFAPNAIPGILRLELRLSQRLGDLHRGVHGPVPRFLGKLRAELCAAAGVATRRVVIIDIRGQNIKLNVPRTIDDAVDGVEVGGSSPVPVVPPIRTAPAATARSQAAASSHPSHLQHSVQVLQPMRFQVREETVVDFEVLPGASEFEPTPGELFRLWSAQLLDAQSGLRQGQLPIALADAKLLRPLPPLGADLAANGTSNATAFAAATPGTPQPINVRSLEDSAYRQATVSLVVVLALLLFPH